MTNDTPREPRNREPSRGTRHPGRTSDAGTRHFRVLVADDDERSLDSLVCLLDREGFTIEPAHCGGEALKRLGLRELASGGPGESEETGRPVVRRLPRPNFDFLVLDYNMPDYTGVEVLRRIRVGLGIALPAILVSGDYSRELQRLWSEVGGFALLPKPVEPDDFRSQVRELVRRFFGGS